ncbi:MAG TPA: asparaginase [Rhizomicrobium sp.]|nr:asparaginase [Rhizomicrobium sp.]
MAKQQIHLLTTGGTIAMRATAEGAGLGAPPPFQEMLEKALPDIEITVRPVLAKPSAGFTFTDIAGIARTAQDSSDQGAGVVITHGTDVLEETAFALELLTRTDTPIVITGAMRLANQPSADGDANLIAACRVAGSEAARGKGALVVFDDEIHWGPLARKRHAFRTHAFSSEPFGPLGWVREGEVRITLAPVRRLPHLSWGSGNPVIPVLEVGPGMEPSVLEKMDGCDALVLAVTGGGHIADATIPALEKLVARMPVVFASRTGAGETLTRSYGFAGGEMDLIRRGLIPAAWLDGRKSRMALAILLSKGASRADISAFFAGI